MAKGPKATKLVALCTAALTGAGAFALATPQAAFAAQILGLGGDVSVVAGTATTAVNQDVTVSEGLTSLAGNYKLKITQVSGTTGVKVLAAGTTEVAQPAVDANGVVDLFRDAAATADFDADGTPAN